LLTLLSLLAAAAVLLAAATLAKARRQAKRLERLTELYWELRYEHGQLRARVNRLDPEQPGAPPEPATPAGATAFVPLSSLKQRSESN
jgi:type II secretory pathway component PulJ